MRRLGAPRAEVTSLLRALVEVASGLAAPPPGKRPRPARSAKWTIRTRSGEVLDADVERNVRRAVSLARPSQHHVERGVPCRVAFGGGDVEMELTWPADEPGAAATTIAWCTTIARFSTATDDGVDAIRWATALADAFQPDAIEIGAIELPERVARSVWAAGHARWGSEPLEHEGTRLRTVTMGKVVVHVAHAAKPGSRDWGDVAARRWLEDAYRRGAPPAKARPILVQAPAPPVVERVEAARSPVRRMEPTPAAATESTLALDESGEVGASEEGFREALTTVPLPRMTLEQYAAFHAEVRIKGGAMTPNLGRRYGVASEAVHRALVQRWRKAFEADAALADRFVVLVQQFMKTFGG